MRSGWFAACMGLCLLLTGCGRGENPIRQFSAAELEYLGQQIFQQENAKTRSNPVLTEAETAKGAAKDKLVGWVFSGNKVRWLRDGKAGVEVAYDVFLAGDEPPMIFAPVDRRLAPEEVSKWGAETLARQNIEKPCSDSYDMAAIRDKDGGWLVWALAVAPGKSIAGGHYRFMISPDGEKILQRDALSKDCQARAGDVAQSVSDLPVETDVWRSLQSKAPITVATPDGAKWRIENGKIRKAE